jgi:hypothetical protein
MFVDRSGTIDEGQDEGQKVTNVTAFGPALLGVPGLS